MPTKKPKLEKRLLPVLLLLLPALGCDGAADPAASNGAEGDVQPAGVVNVYSSRHYDTDDDVYAAFTAATGIEVEIIEGDSAALLERLRREGERSPADLFLTVDAGRLNQAEREGIFAPVSSPILESRVPPNLRHPDNLWFGITKRARILVVSKERVAEGSPATYEELADPKWRGQVLVRSSGNVYNQSLMGSILEAHGEAAAEEWCRGLVANFARDPQGGDRDQIRGVAAGEGDVAISNSYYLARMIAGSEEDRAAAAAVRPVFPNQEDRGTHVNVSGAGVVVGAENRDQALRLLEFMVGDQAQKIYTEGNKEYSVVPGFPIVAELVEFGSFKEDAVNASVLGANNEAALRIMDRCAWR